MPLYRPEPILTHDARTVDRTAAPRMAAAHLASGGSLIVSDRYSTGGFILAQLHALLEPPPADAPYRARQAFQRAYRQASMRLLAPISKHQIALSDTPEIGFLKELYPERSTFVLPYVEVQDLAAAWKRYHAGVPLAVVGHAVHPYYGTYVPTRTSHLELFGTWLSAYQGPRVNAIDVGTGCGVLALMLARRGFEQILATDTNPNAVESVRREVRGLATDPPITAVQADLLGDGTEPVELVVFNPPWTRGRVDGLLDQALYYDDDGLFERFFEQALARLTPDGRVVFVFSNVTQLVQPDTPHPIEVELERGRFRLVQKLNRKVKAFVDKDGNRRSTRERVEVWELARA